MKKLIALTLAILMVVSMVACSKDEKKETPATTAATVAVTTPTIPPVVPTIPTPPVIPTEPTPANDPAVEAFVAEYGDMLIDELEGGIAESAGMTCTSTIEVAGNGFIVYMNVNGMNNMTADEKAAAQEAFDAFGDALDASLLIYQAQVPELQYFNIVVCEEDGDEIATMTADGISSGNNTLGTGSMTLAEFVEMGGAAFGSSLEESFEASSGLTCTSEVEVEGTSLIVIIKIDSLDNLSADEKTAMQTMLAAEEASLAPALQALQTQVSGLETMIFRICEADGDLVAEVSAK